MKKALVLLAALTLSLGSVQDASFSATDTYRNLAVWHSDEANRYRASYAYTSLSEVIGAYWTTLGALGYSGTVTETALGSSSYVFIGASEQLEAVFTLLGDTMTVTFTQLGPNTLDVSAAPAAYAS